MTNTLSKKNNTEVTILLPLPPTAGWKGEGIAETIENIIKNTSTITYHLIVGRHLINEISTGELSEKIKAQTLTLTPVGWYSKKIDLKTSRIVKRLSLILFKISFWAFLLKAFIKYIFSAPKAETIWIPIPMFGIFGKLFAKKLIISFWDPFVFEYSGFDAMQKIMCLSYMKAGLKTADVIITQSLINRNFLVDFLNIDKEKVNLVKNGSPDYSNFIIDKNITIDNIKTYWNTGHQDNTDNRNYLTNLLLFAFKKANLAVIRQELNKCILHRLITKASHKESKIIIISTQYRPYKGFGSLFKVLNKIIENYSDSFDFKFIFTGFVPEGFFREYPWAYGCIFEMNRVTTEQHAYIYAISDLAVHPSFVEGGLGTYPMFESASVGVPSLSHIGRHMLELEDDCNKSLEIMCIDLLTLDKAVETIMNMLTNASLRSKNIELINSIKINWQDIGNKYTELFKRVTDVA
ncbi:Glycosyl transferase, group 1 family protein (plasmid) [Rickettsiales bacterium Ac37b]|nr:Glycosyl transferase, group 1 family protein [Rickettsiales bacterium Ac37b]